MSSCTGCGSTIDLDSIIIFMSYVVLMVGVAFLMLKRQKRRFKNKKN